MVVAVVADSVVVVVVVMFVADSVVVVADSVVVVAAGVVDVVAWLQMSGSTPLGVKEMSQIRSSLASSRHSRLGSALYVQATQSGLRDEADLPTQQTKGKSVLLQVE